MNGQIMVSVICNVYNHEPYVRDALEGFVSQKTDFPFEVLIHDDASTDRSAEIIREYEKKYPDIIKPIYQTMNQYSRGGAITKRFQLPRVKGKYIAMCEGDDYWTDPLKLKKQYDFMETNPDYALCACSTVWVDMRTGKTRNRCRTVEDCDISIEDIILQKMDRTFQYATVFLPAEIYMSRPEWARKFRVGDVPLALHAATCGKVRMLADVMAVYRAHSAGSWTARVNADAAYKTEMLQGMVDGLDAFNKATDFQHDAVITQRIKQQKYNIARTNRNLKAMRTGELREIYLARPLITRISDILACKTPGLHAAVCSVLKKE